MPCIWALKKSTILPAPRAYRPRTAKSGDPPNFRVNHAASVGAMPCLRSVLNAASLVVSSSAPEKRANGLSTVSMPPMSIFPIRPPPSSMTDPPMNCPGARERGIPEKPAPLCTNSCCPLIAGIGSLPSFRPRPKGTARATFRAPYMASCPRICARGVPHSTT